MRNGIAAALGVLGGGIVGYSVGIAPTWLRVTRLQVRLPGLPAEWQGVRIAHLSDFHVGGRGVTLDMLARARRISLAFDPDIVALTGDYYDEGRWADTGGLYTEWPSGPQVFGVLGNHDWRGGREHVRRVVDELRAGGVRMLNNEAACMSLRGRKAWIAGVDDPHTRRDEVGRAFQAVPDDEDVLLLLAHSPSAVVSLPFGRAGMMLSGHTHGGQVRLLPSGRLPFVGTIRRMRNLRPLPPLPLVRGYHWEKGTAVIISDGLGISTIRARFRTRPHLILIELDRAPEQGPDCNDVERYIVDRSDESRITRWLT